MEHGRICSTGWSWEMFGGVEMIVIVGVQVMESDTFGFCFCWNIFFCLNVRLELRHVTVASRCFHSRVCTPKTDFLQA